jgi:hypothetical protein
VPSGFRRSVNDRSAALELIWVIYPPTTFSQVSALSIARHVCCVVLSHTQETVQKRAELNEGGAGRMPTVASRVM